MKKSLLESLTELQRNDFIGSGREIIYALVHGLSIVNDSNMSNTIEMMLDKVVWGDLSKLDRHDFDQERFEPMTYTLTNLTITKVSPYQNHN
ncbi:hypothetical protein KV201_00900 [Shewanella sp. SR1]|uniref:hypothetical protein n=1 Tax=Shewanella sp. SR1 TaxID=2855505 RepID=UPI001CF48AEB|nr:hypothetical protein [Shewanella sp. SR1]MCB2380753.1 hypothetical protein [Shewanella sp. SR1]